MAFCSDKYRSVWQEKAVVMNGKDQVIALLFALTALTSPDLHTAHG